MHLHVSTSPMSGPCIAMMSSRLLIASEVDHIGEKVSSSDVARVRPAFDAMI
jgi:hypothetical protein